MEGDTSLPRGRSPHLKDKNLWRESVRPQGVGALSAARCTQTERQTELERPVQTPLNQASGLQRSRRGGKGLDQRGHWRRAELEGKSGYRQLECA